MNRKHCTVLLVATAFLAVAMLTACSSGRKNDLEKANLKGRVKQMTELINNQMSDTLFRETDPSEEKTEYDMMRVLDFYPNGLLKNLRLITEKGTTVQKYEYDKDSLLTQVLLFADGKLANYEEYTYNPDKSKQTRIIKDTADKVLVTINYRYDRKGNLTEEREEYAGAEMTIVRRYKHDNKGRRTEKTEARNGLESNIVEKYTYNDMNEIAEISTTDVTPQETPYSVIQHYAYPETDSVGNWTVREIKGQVPGYKDEIIQRWERTIEYYQ